MRYSNPDSLHPPRSLVGLLALVSAALLLLWASAASAQVRARVAVLRFEGAPRLQAAVAAELSKDYHLVPLTEWEATAQELNATGRTSDQIAIVALQVHAEVVVMGLVRKDERGVWMITVATRSGSTGKMLSKERFPLVSPTTSRDVLTFIGPAVAEALKRLSEAPAPPSVSAPPSGGEMTAPGEAPSPGQPNPEDAPIDPRLLEEAMRPLPAERRPVWYPYVDLSVGLVFGGRSLSFDEEVGLSPVGCYDFHQPIVDPSAPTPTGNGPLPIVHQITNRLQRCPRFPAAVTGGLRLDATVYPFAGAARPSRLLRGLGLGMTADVMFWPATATCSASASGSGCDSTTNLATQEYRVEAGLRWAVNVLDRRSRVTLLFSLQYGVHYFGLQKTPTTYEYFDPQTNQREMVAGLDDRGLPDVKYQYLTFGVGARVPYYASRKWAIGLVLQANYHAMLSSGEISARFNDTSSYEGLYQGGGYGPTSSSHGLRVQLTPIELMPWRGLTIRLSGSYEAFLMKFAVGGEYLSGAMPVEPQNLPPSDSARHLARGATDQYFGGVLQVGYQY